MCEVLCWVFYMCLISLNPQTSSKAEIKTFSMHGVTEAQQSCDLPQLIL